MIVGCGRVRLGSRDQWFGEMEQLVKPGCTWENEGCRIKHDAVADARGVGVGDEAVVSAIVSEGGSEVKTDAPMVVPFGAAGVVGDE